MELAEVISLGRRLCAEATPGPMRACSDEDGAPVVCITPDHAGPVIFNCDGEGGRVYALTLTDGDAAFIAWAYNNAERLLSLAAAGAEMRACVRMEDGNDSDDGPTAFLYDGFEEAVAAWDAAREGGGKT